MKKLIFVLLIIILGVPLFSSFAQSDPLPLPEDFQAELDTAIANDSLDVWWDSLEASGQIPYVDGDTAIFLFRTRTNPTSVAIAGDFNRWQADQTSLEQYGDVKLWYRAIQFPSDARLDYIYVLDGTRWMIDPANDNRQMSGFGNNSSVAMGDYVPSVWVTPQEDISTGELSGNMRFESDILDTDFAIRVYTPPNYDDLQDLPVIYTTDGHEFLDDDMGSMVTVTDNLLSEGLINPYIIVFIDMRNPDNFSANRRENLLIYNLDFSGFIVSELIPYIDDNYKTNASREARMMFGTSYGGDHSISMAAFHHETVANFGIFSPSQRWRAPYETLDEFETAPNINIFLVSGNPRWDADIEHLYQGLDAKGYQITSHVVNQGHSWGNWRDAMDDILLHFFAVNTGGNS